MGGQISAPRNAFQREEAQKLFPNFVYQVRRGKLQFPSVWRGIPEIVLISLKYANRIQSFIGNYTMSRRDSEFFRH